MAKPNVDEEFEVGRFKFVQFNPRRCLRGKEAARVEANGQWLWMSRNDIELNIWDFGPHPELLKAREAYERPNVEFRLRDQSCEAQ